MLNKRLPRTGIAIAFVDNFKMKILWHLLTFLFGLVGLLATIRLIERLSSGAGLLPAQLLIALVMLVLAWLCLRKARAD